MDSILSSVKKQCGIPESCKDFDDVLITHINAAFLTLTQIGVGPEEGFTIENSESTWKDFVGEMNLLKAVETWTGLKVRMIFDPPTNSILKEAIKENLTELEWRIGIVADPVSEEE